MERRHIREIREDLNNFLTMARLFRKMGDMVAYSEYLLHINAMERELNLRRCGAANVL